MGWYRSRPRGFRYRDRHERRPATESQWGDWSSHCSLQGHWRDAIVRSLITLRMLTYRPTGGIVAAATTSLPEWIGGGGHLGYPHFWDCRAAPTPFGPLWSGHPRRAPAGARKLPRAGGRHASRKPNLLRGARR